MQVRRVGQKSKTYIGRKCKICGLSAKGGEIIVTGFGWNSDFFHRDCTQTLFDAFDEKLAEKGNLDPVVKGMSRKEIKAQRLEDEFETLRLNMLKGNQRII